MTWAIAGLVLACDTAPRIGTTSMPIINGDSEPGFEAVGALVLDVPDRDPTGSFCTGTLIDPSWVLTAAHCIRGGEGRVPNSAPPSESFYINLFIGENAGNQIEGRRVPARRVFIHPQYGVPGASRLYDIALFELESPVTDVAPIPIHRGPLPNGIATDVFFVGYGQSDGDGGGSGRRRSTTLQLQTITPANLMTVQGLGGVCFGDSGGPALLDVNGTWQVIGVNSTVVGDPACFGHSVQVRVDAFQSWIDATMNTGGADCRTDQSLCDCPQACGEDGVCDPGLCGASGCEALFGCIQRCRTSQCAVLCLLNAAAEPNYLFDRLNGCISTNCPNRNSECIDQFCRRDEVACTDGLEAVTGDGTCNDIFGCASLCEIGNENCIDACFFRGTLDAQERHEAVEACVTANCASPPWTPTANACRALECREDLLGCMPDESCRMVGGNCENGTACVAETWAATYCRPSFGAAINEPCSPFDVSCVDGAVCIDVDGVGVCREVCTVAADCERSFGPCTPTVRAGAFSIGVCSNECPDADEDGACDDVDCAPYDSAMFPGAEELCDDDAFDENCNGQHNENCTTAPAPLLPPTEIDDGFCTCVQSAGGAAWSILLLVAPLLIRRRHLLVVLLGVVACGEDPTGAPLADAGMPTMDAGMSFVDAGPIASPTIWTIQQGLVSPGTRVALDDVVVSSPESADGFFLSDGTSRPYAGVWVASVTPGPTPTVEMGDVVRVVGTVRERTFTSTTGFSTASRTELVLDTPTDITVIRTSTVPRPVAISVYELALPEIAELYEGVIVRVDDVTVSGIDQQNGAFEIDDLIVVDDLFVGVDFVWTSTGSRFGSITGALHFDDDRFLLLPRNDDDLTIAEIDPLGCIPTAGYTICTRRVRWGQAAASCAAQGGRLPVLPTQESNVALGTLSRVWTERAFWIGATDRFTEGEWTWVDGSTLTYDPWANGEPNNAGRGEDCAHNNWRGDGEWNDANCNSRQHYACEFRGEGARCVEDVDCGDLGRCDEGDCVAD